MTKISDYEMSLINQSRKILLFNEKNSLVGSDGSENCYVSM